MTNRTLFLRPQNSQAFSLPYSLARAALDEVDASEERRFQKDMKTAQQLRRQAAKLNNIGINSGSDLLVVKTKQLKQRAERLEDTARPAHQERSAGAIKLGQSRHARKGAGHSRRRRGDDARWHLAVQDRKALDLPGRPHRPARAQRRRQDAADHHGSGTAIVGPAGVDEAIKATPSLVLGYGDQDLSEFSDGETRLPRICRRFEIGEQRARSLLAGAGLAVEKQASAIGRLSAARRPGWRCWCCA